MAQVKEYLEVTRWSLMERNGFFSESIGGTYILVSIQKVLNKLIRSYDKSACLNLFVTCGV